MFSKMKWFGRTWWEGTNSLHESDLNFSHNIFRKGFLVDKNWIGSLNQCINLFWPFRRSETLNLGTTDTVKILVFVPFMEGIVIDSWGEIKQGTQFEALRQVISQSKEFIPPEWLSQTTFRFVKTSLFYLTVFVTQTVSFSTFN